MKNRFLSKVDKRSGCWVWTGRITEQGYGQFAVKSKPRAAHRVSFELFNGPIPEGKIVRHRCDNPICVNPKHLFLGTVVDNARDRVLRKRDNPPSGDRHWTRQHPEWIVRGKRGPVKRRGRLNVRKAEQVKMMFNAGKYTKSDLARRFRVSIGTISGVVTGRVWRSS